MATVTNVASQVQLDALSKNYPAVVVHFWADWCEPCKHMDVALEKLAIENPHASFARVQAEELPTITERYNVDTVPFCVIIKGEVVIDTVEGANPPELASKVALHVKTASLSSSLNSSLTPSAPTPTPTASAAKPEVDSAKIEKLLNSASVLLFMKGNKNEPRCGFSSKVVAALTETKIPFETFDILQNEEIRQGLKVYSNWPTYPQLYVKGELLGGCDIILEMAEAGELKETIQESLGEESKDLKTRIQELLSSADILLFMKGDPKEPRCGFSRKTVEALEVAGLPFRTFDILQNEEIRQGLKEYSNWPTYPQLYVKGELLGGCDIILEMHQSGELKTAIQDTLAA